MFLTKPNIKRPYSKNESFFASQDAARPAEILDAICEGLFDWICAIITRPRKVPLVRDTVNQFEHATTVPLRPRFVLLWKSFQAINFGRRFDRRTPNRHQALTRTAFCDHIKVVIRLPDFIGTFEGVMDEAYRDPLDAAHTTKLRDLSDSLGKLQDMVEQTVDLDALDRHEYIIKSEYDQGLRVIRKKLDQLDRDIRAEFQ
ncbi:MSH2 protein [Conoideocrella luteorostrata]|uniref:MSH2 protein n=1 Tax=Conoideocrella luteorostrata TaxID=1105319 RepID=A0AAJ0CAS4_9HYPO|nr:MSH2 protein [Conoideocrella luteorostrata]